MNMNRFARSLMAREKSPEEYLMFIADVVERQLQEWGETYEVFVMKMHTYELIVKRGDERYYHVYLSEEEIYHLQQKEPYELDRFIWKELKKQGLPIIRGGGNYIDYVI